MMLSALLAAGTLLAAAPLVPALAATEMPAGTQSMTPKEMHADGITYATGGTGENEAQAFKQMMDKYPLAIELVQKQKSATRDAYTANALVRISDHAGKEIFKAEAKGPFMLVRLDPGKYSMTATLNGHRMNKREFTVAQGKTTHETVVFPAGTD